MATSNRNKRLAANRESLYPQLRADGYKVTSEESPIYNCVAWASHETRRWWWPDKAGLYYWPTGVSREETLAAFIAMYEKVGYRACNNAQHETGWEKIAIYVTALGIPTHVARQIGKAWTSKLGRCEDIEHKTLEALAGNPPAYGQIGQIMKREV